MTATPTKAVRWPAKFGQRTVLIAAADFDPAVHRDPDAPDDPPPSVGAAPTAAGSGDVDRGPRRRRGE